MSAVLRTPTPSTAANVASTKKSAENAHVSITEICSWLMPATTNRYGLSVREQRWRWLLTAALMLAATTGRSTYRYWLPCRGSMLRQHHSRLRERRTQILPCVSVADGRRCRLGGAVDVRAEHRRDGARRGGLAHPRSRAAVAMAGLPSPEPWRSAMPDRLLPDMLNTTLP
jgi:hypothetical protein